MKSRILLPALVCICFLVHKSYAEMRDAIITWSGDAGYSAQINMSYDDSFAIVGAWGGGPPFLGGTPTNQGISQLSVAFLAPSLQPLFATNDIYNGTINYKFLSLSFDTVANTLFGSLDVGKDSFAEEEPGSSEGQFFLTGVSFPTLHDSFLVQVVDSGGEFTVTVVPEPSTWSMSAAAVVAFVTFRRSNWLCQNRLTKS